MEYLMTLSCRLLISHVPTFLELIAGCRGMYERDNLFVFFRLTPAPIDTDGGH